MTELVRVADAETRLRSAGHAILLVVGAFALGFLLALTAAQSLVSLGYSLDGDRLSFIVATSVFQFVGFYAAVYWYARTVDGFRELVYDRRPVLRDVAWVVGAVLVLLGVNYVLSELLFRIGLEGAQNEIITEGRERPALFLYLIPVTVLFVAPAEELVFRGVVQGLFRRAWGVLPGVLVASAFFAVAHYLALGAGGSRLATIVVIFVLGSLLGAVYELSGSIVVSTAVHAGWNVLIFAWEYAAVTGLV